MALDLQRSSGHFVANPDLAREMGRRAREAFENRFDFPIAISAWEKALGVVPDELAESVYDNTRRFIGCSSESTND